jgi:effector-binding domain-containing protein
MKKVALIALGAAALGLLWYLFLRPFEFQVNFTSRTLPGDVIQTIRVWDRSNKSVEVLAVDSLFGVRQKVSHNGREYLYDWRFRAVDDSLTNVKIRISEPGNQLRNKLLVPFSKPQIEKDAEEVARKFYSILSDHLRITRVRVLGESQTKSSFCVCKNLETTQAEKAHGMMSVYGILTSFVANSNLQPNGPPIVRIRKWNHSKGKLNYDFCFPIVKREGLPKSDSLTYQEFLREKAIKAIYNGNYITSDRAWYELNAFAEREGKEINGLPIEYFYNNPNLGFGEENWKAEVYLPIK